MSISILRPICFLLVFAALAGSAAAQDVTVRWIPQPAPGIVGYNVYIARMSAGALVAVPIDVGRPQPDSQGIASVRLIGIDRTAPLLSIEMTSYDSLGRESPRSNRVLLVGDGETVAEPSWSADFEFATIGNRAPGFIDWGGAFAVGQLGDGNLVFGSTIQSQGGLSVSRQIGWMSASWAPYELEGRMSVLLGSTAAGVGVRVGAWDLSSAFLLGGDASGEFALDQIGKPSLRCAVSPSTGVRISRGRWFRFRLRHTAPDGRARLRAKIWRPGDIEPSLWQADCWTDVPPTSDNGTFALYQAGNGITYWDDLVVRPVTGTFSRPPSP